MPTWGDRVETFLRGTLGIAFAMALFGDVSWRIVLIFLAAALGWSVWMAIKQESDRP